MSCRDTLGFALSLCVKYWSPAKSRLFSYIKREASREALPFQLFSQLGCINIFIRFLERFSVLIANSILEKQPALFCPSCLFPLVYLSCYGHAESRVTAVKESH